MSSTIRVYMEAPKTGHLAKKLAAMAIVASGYGGDIDEDMADELLDNMDFNKYNKVCCPKIESMLPMLDNLLFTMLLGKIELKSN